MTRSLACAAIVLAAPASAPAQSRTWTAGFGLDQAWDSNPYFVVTDGAGDRLHSAHASIGHTRAGRRSALSASLGGGATLYGDQKSLNSGLFFGSFSASRQLSSRTSLSARETFSSTRTGQSTVLTEAGLPLPQSRALTANGGLQIAHRASAATTLQLDLGHETARFDFSGLVNGSTYFAGASLHRRIGARQSLSASYGALGSHTPGRMSIHHTLGASGQRSVGRSWSASASLGIARFDGVVNGSPWTFIGGASIAGKFRRDSVSASYGRSVGQAFGLGHDRTANNLSSGYSRTLGRRLVLSTSIRWVFSSAPGRSSFLYRSEYYSGTAHYRLNPHLDASAGYTRRRSVSPAPGPTISGDYFGLSMGYGWASHDRRGATP